MMNTPEDCNGKVTIIISFYPLVESIIHEMVIPYEFNDFNLNCFNDLYDCLVTNNDMKKDVIQDAIDRQNNNNADSTISVIIDYVRDADGNIIYSEDIAQLIFIPSNDVLFNKLKTIITKNTNKVILCNPVIQS